MDARDFRRRMARLQRTQNLEHRNGEIQSGTRILYRDSNMLNYVHAKIANLRGRNTESTPVSVIKNQLREPRSLPIGLVEFEAWASRIIEGAMVKADPESQRFALAAMITQLGKKDIFMDDAHFIVELRRSAIEQTAQYVMKEIKDAQAQRRAAGAQPQGAVTPNPGVTNEVLPNKAV